MPSFFSWSDYAVAAAAIEERTRLRPEVGLILGSGLNSLVEAVEDSVVIPYQEIPDFPQTSVSGHEGRLVLGRLRGTPVAVMQGRVHYYEGHSIAEITFPVRVMQVMGIEILIVTNAAGGLNPGFQAGDVMLIMDHINLIGMGGLNPLRGPNVDRIGPRFPDMSQPYDEQLRALAESVAASENVPFQKGVYVCVAGPSFETPADSRFLRLIGADAVGMSTVPEVIIARHGGTRVLGLSGISNVISLDGAPPSETSHEEVLEAGVMLVPRLLAIVSGILRQL